MRTAIPSSLGSRPVRLLQPFDVASAIGAFALAVALVSALGGAEQLSRPSIRDILGFPLHRFLFLAIALLLWIAVGLLIDNPDARNFSNLFRRLALWIAAATVAICVLKLHGVNSVFLISFFVIFVAATAVKFHIENSAGVMTKHSQTGATQAVVVGALEDVSSLVTLLAAKGIYSSVSAREASTLETLQKTSHDRLDIFLFASGQQERTVQRVLPKLVTNGAKVHLVPALFETLAFRCTLNHFEGVPVVTLEKNGIKRSQLVVKRAMDIICSLILIAFSAPIMLLIAAAIKLTSKGPVLFAHTRLGRNGKPLKVYKFRTMRADAEDILKRTPGLYAEYVENNYKLSPERDFRVTSLGRFLRASSLDELPQLFNVLSGGMSLVGPRPIVPEEIAQYGPYGQIFLSVKPGVTGNWQVSGRSAIRDYQQRVRLDLEYIRDQSLAKDFEILFRTMGAVRRMEGAY